MFVAGMIFAILGLLNSIVGIALSATTAARWIKLLSLDLVDPGMFFSISGIILTVISLIFFCVAHGRAKQNRQANGTNFKYFK